MVQQFNTQHPYGGSQLLTPAPEDLTPSSGPYRYCMHVLHMYIHTHTYKHTGKTPIHIQLEIIFLKIPSCSSQNGY